MACTQHVRVTSLLTWTHRGCTPRDPTRTSVTFPISFHVESYTNEINNMLRMLNDGCSMIHSLQSYHFCTRVLYIHYCVCSMEYELEFFFLFQLMISIHFQTNHLHLVLYHYALQYKEEINAKHVINWLVLHHEICYAITVKMSINSCICFQQLYR